MVGEYEYFKTIADAIKYAKTLDNNKKYTIMIKDGIYLESLNLQGVNNINIVGIDKETCIIEDRSGDYNNAPLTTNGSGYFSNITFYSNHKENSNYQIRSYAMHLRIIHLGIDNIIVSLIIVNLYQSKILLLVLE